MKDFYYVNRSVTINHLVKINEVISDIRDELELSDIDTIEIDQMFKERALSPGFILDEPVFGVVYLIIFKITHTR